MTQGDQLTRPLRSRDARDAGHTQSIPLLEGGGEEGGVRVGSGEVHGCGGGGGSQGGRFRADADDVRGGGGG